MKVGARWVVLVVASLPTMAHIACSGEGDAAQDNAGDAGGEGSTVQAEGGAEGAVYEPIDYDTGPPPVTLILTRLGAPFGGVPVVFSDSAGEVLSTGTTDGSGRIARQVPAGSQVTALLGSELNVHLYTVVGVEPGDELTAADPVDEEAGVTGTATILQVPGSPPAGTLGYGAHSGECRSGFTTGDAPPWAHTLYEPCQRHRRFPVMLVADGDQGELGFAFKKGNAFNEQATASLSVPGPWLTNMRGLEVAVSGTRSESTAVLLSEWADGVGKSQLKNVAVPAGGAAQKATFIVHPGYADVLQVETRVRRVVAGGRVAYRLLASRVAPSAASTSVNVSALLPEISTATLDVSRPARPKVSWTSAAPIQGADGVYVRVTWDAALDGGYTRGDWTVVAPPTATSVSFPAVPVGGVVPTRAGSFVKKPVIVVLEHAAFRDYAAMRAAAGVLPDSTQAVQDRPLRAVLGLLEESGLLRVTALTDVAD